MFAAAVDVVGAVVAVVVDVVDCVDYCDPSLLLLLKVYRSNFIRTCTLRNCFDLH